MRISDWSSDVCSSDLLGGGISARFIPAGHLLGAAQILMTVGGRTIHFSGDVGRNSDPLMRGPQPFTGADILVCERSEEHTSELQSLMRISYAVFCLKKKNTKLKQQTN